MEYGAILVLNQSYFEESFEQWLEYRSKFRKWQVRISIPMLIFGIYLMSREMNALSIGVTIIGVVEFVEFYFYRHRWIKQRIEARSGNTDNRVEIRISESGMYQKGPTSEGTSSWDAVKEVCPTAKGLFLAIGDGMSIYIPNSSMIDHGFGEFVVKMVQGDT